MHVHLLILKIHKTIPVCFWWWPDSRCI